MIVKKTSIFPTSKKEIFSRLQESATLTYIAAPYATFEILENESTIWQEGSTSSFRFKLFGVIPFGIHTIHIVRFDPDGISSKEHNTYVRVWDHDISLEAIDDGHTRYTDKVDIEAGWKTFFIWLWAKAFYAHRQRKWIRLLGENNEH